MINKSSQKIFNNSIMYVLGTIASKATAFLLIPFYTNCMTKEEYGIATTITTFVGVFGIVAMLSLRAAIMRFYNDYEGEKRKVFMGTIIITVLLNSVLFSGLLCLLKDFYIDFLFKDIPFFPLVLIGIISLTFEGVYLVYQSFLQAKQDGKNYSINSFLYLLINCIFVIILVVLCDLAVLGVVVANLMSNFLFAVYGIISMLKKKIFVFKFDFAMFKLSVKYSLPILPHNLSNNMKTYFAKIIISNCLTYALSGLYSLASQFASIVNIIQYSINLAFRPWFIEQIKLGEEGRAQIKHMTQLITALFSFICVSVSVFSKELVQILSSDSFLSAWTMIPILVFSQLITFVYYSHVQSLMYNIKMSKYAAVCSITGLVSNVVLSIVLVRYIGIYGIVVAQLLGQTILSAMVVILNKYAENVDFGLGGMIFMLVSSAVLMAAGVGLTFLIGNKISAIVSILLRALVVLLAFFLFIFKNISDFKLLLLGMFKRKVKKNG